MVKGGQNRIETSYNQKKGTTHKKSGWKHVIWVVKVDVYHNSSKDERGSEKQ